MRRLLRVVALLVVIGVGALVSSLARNNPPWGDPPGFAARLQTYLTTHVAETRPDSPFPELRSRHYPGLAPERLYGLAVEALQAMPRTRIAERRPAAREVHAVVRTPLVGYRDDLTIRVEPDGTGGGSVLVARSASRVGKGDLAANTRHLLDFYARLDALVPPPQGRPTGL
ncbi:MAG TPA: DUF1499 domain-containing protein [Candidatus Binatia bacterium]|nr:DUF1499 domain-containing protein [Candidatus Binatia bacterium]